MKNRYFLLRHGENTYKIKHKDLIYPSKDSNSIKLTGKGINQVKESLKKIKGEKIDIIFSSDFCRTRQTAEIAAKALRIKEINFDKRLRDFKIGIFHGKKKEDFYRFVGYKKRNFSTKIPGGESWADLKVRTKDFLKDVEKKHKGNNILIVGHGDPLWIAEGIIRKMSNQELLNEIFLKKRFIQMGELRKIN